LVVEITPISIKTLGYRTYIYFCVFNFCFIPIIYWFYPETANLSLEEIDNLFTGNKVLLHLPPVGSGSGSRFHVFIQLRWRQADGVGYARGEGDSWTPSCRGRSSWHRRCDGTRKRSFVVQFVGTGINSSACGVPDRYQACRYFVFIKAQEQGLEGKPRGCKWSMKGVKLSTE
jgi:hypothetical protein